MVGEEYGAWRMVQLGGGSTLIPRESTGAEQCGTYPAAALLRITSV